MKEKFGITLGYTHAPDKIRLKPTTASFFHAWFKLQTNPTGACVVFLHVFFADKAISQLPNQLLPAPRFPTQNHNRDKLSKDDAKSKNRSFYDEFKQSAIRSRQGLLLFFQTGQKASPLEMNF